MKTIRFSLALLLAVAFTQQTTIVNAKQIEQAKSKPDLLEVGKRPIYEIEVFTKEKPTQTAGTKDSATSKLSKTSSSAGNKSSSQKNSVSK